ncbi:hypothetical protein KBD75_00535 [Candidatus Woesebacteria bacterium]|nr:hypothetical protein [Candidatus Woesebacteria bacterium]
MKKWLYLIFSVVVIGLSLLLRLYKIDHRAPFDWDQNRDYLAVEQIVAGKPSLVGPVAKGEGGFLLGPLYYYLLVPGFLLTDGNPISLPVSSVLFDVLAIVAILALLPKIWGKPQAILLATAWSLSWFAIESSRVSWNVSLLQLWLVGLIYLLSRPLSISKALLLGLTLGLTWHIHAVLIPLSLLVTLFYLKPLKISWIYLFVMGAGYLFALSPLIIFDVRHAGLERSLIMQFLSQNSSAKPLLSEILTSTLSRFGKNSLAIFSGKGDLSLITGVIAMSMAVLSTIVGTKIAKISGVIVVVNLILVLYLGEIRFPEYYLASCYLPILIIAIDYITRTKTLIKPLAVVAIGIFVYTNLQMYSTEKTSFALGQKVAVVREISKLGNNFDLHYNLPFGRDSGLPLLLRLSGISDSKQAKTQILITESSGDSVFVDGEIAQDLGWFGGFRLAYRVVQ